MQPSSVTFANHVRQRQPFPQLTRNFQRVPAARNDAIRIHGPGSITIGSGRRVILPTRQSTEIDEDTGRDAFARTHVQDTLSFSLLSLPDRLRDCNCCYRIISNPRQRNIASFIILYYYYYYIYIILYYNIYYYYIYYIIIYIIITLLFEK